MKLQSGKLFGAAAFFLAVLLSTCAGGGETRPTGEAVKKDISARSLRELAVKYQVDIGGAVSPKALKDERLRAVLAEQFSSLTPENELKFYTIRAQRGAYNFAPADLLIKFAEENHMKVRGHTLLWHKYQPRWLEDGTWTKEELMAQLKEFITTVVTRYKGKVDCWDVVNEVVDDVGDLYDGNTSVWARIGDDYIEKAFRWAHEADPGAKLFINDWGVAEVNFKSTGIYNVVKKLLAKGVPIHGFGAQCHLVEGWPPDWGSVAENVKRFRDLGLDVHFTEIDVRIAGDITKEKLAGQAEIYRDLMKVALSSGVTSFTTWGVSDAYSWVPQAFPEAGAALLFNEKCEPKPAYFAVRDILVKGP